MVLRAVKPVKRADFLRVSPPSAHVLRRELQRPLHAGVVQHPEHRLARKTFPDKRHERAKTGEVHAGIGSRGVDQAVGNLVACVEDGLDHRAVCRHVRHKHGDVGKRTVPPRPITAPFRLPDGAENRVVRHLDLAADAGRADDLDGRVLRLHRADISGPFPNRCLDPLQHGGSRALRVLGDVPPFEFNGVLVAPVLLLEIDQEAQRLSPGDAPFTEEFVFDAIDIRVGVLCRTKPLQHLLLFVRLHISPVFEANVVVIDNDIVRLRQPVEDLRLKRRKRREPENVDRTPRSACQPLARPFEKLAQGEVVPTRRKHALLAKELLGERRLRDFGRFLDGRGPSLVKPLLDNLLAMDFVLVHEIGKFYGKLPGHPGLAARIYLERATIAFRHVSPERSEFVVIVLQQYRHDGVRVCVHRQKLQTALAAHTLAQQSQEPLFDERELHPHAKRRRIRKHTNLQPLGDVGVGHNHLRELERIDFRPLRQQTPLQIRRQVLNPVAVVDS